MKYEDWKHRELLRTENVVGLRSHYVVGLPAAVSGDDGATCPLSVRRLYIKKNFFLIFKIIFSGFKMHFCFLWKPTGILSIFSHILPFSSGDGFLTSDP